MKIQQKPSPVVTKRSGFTLIEIMIVIVIITILIGLLVPVIASVRQNVRNTAVRTEISGLEASITTFKVTYGMEPPSLITVHEVPAGWGTQGSLTSRALIRRMWPQFNFNVQRDLNGDGQATSDPDGDGNPGVTLNGAECLVFFLGGIFDPNLNAHTGFAKNPANPFSTGGNREGPFFNDFGTRLVDQNANGFFEFVDGLPSQQYPYLYLSSYEGRGYSPNDEQALLSVMGPGQQTAFRAYRQLGEDLDGNNVLDPGEDANGNGQLTQAPFNPKKFQIISPGVDQAYGQGGTFDPDQTTLFLSGARAAEADNITNIVGRARLGG